MVAISIALTFFFSFPCLFFFSHQIKEMAKELDTLLESIEETGGFGDACTVFQKSSVEALEQGISFLSDKCRSRKVIFVCD